MPAPEAARRDDDDDDDGDDDDADDADDADGCARMYVRVFC